MTTTTVRRVARKPRPCGDMHPIRPGEAYLLHTAFPGDDMGYATQAGHPVRFSECAACARRYGRGHLLDPEVTSASGDPCPSSSSRRPPGRC